MISAFKLKIDASDLSRRAYLFPLINLGGGGWRWEEILKFKTLVLWFMVAGNLVFGGLFTLLFGRATLEALIDPKTYSDIVKHPFFIVVLSFFFILGLGGVACLVSAVRLANYLVRRRRQGHQ